MAKLPAMQNQYVEFAKNDGKGKEIDIEAIETGIEEEKISISIPILTEDNALEIFAKKPKFISYDELVYVLNDYQSAADELYYSSIYNTYNNYLYINNAGVISANSNTLALASDIKDIYWHGLYIGDDTAAHNLQAHILNNSESKIDSVLKLIEWFENTYTAGNNVVLSVNGGFTRASTTYNAFAIVYNGTNYIVYYTTSSGVSTYSMTALTDVYSRVVDNLNKIN